MRRSFSGCVFPRNGTKQSAPNSKRRPGEPWGETRVRAAVDRGGEACGGWGLRISSKGDRLFLKEAAVAGARGWAGSDWVRFLREIGSYLSLQEQEYQSLKSSALLLFFYKPHRQSSPQHAARRQKTVPCAERGAAHAQQREKPW